MATTQTARKAPATAAKAVAAKPATPVAPTLPVKSVPTAAAVAAALANPAAATYSLGNVGAVANHLTLQRGCTTTVGKQWRSNGHKAPNTRHIVISVLAGLGATFTHAQAVAALAPLKANATLGSGSPASYIRAFVKQGYLYPVA